MCASHNGEPAHIEGAREILAAAGRTERDLECGFHFPEDPETARRLHAAPLEERSPIYNNCSGKHAGMVALAVREGWPVEGYTRADHPVQQLLVRTVCEIAGVDPERAPLGVDGCSAMNPAMTLIAMARSFARLATARADAANGASTREQAMARIRNAMSAHPDMVAGRKRFCTAFMNATRGRIMTKTGAEGVQCVSVPARGLGICVKARDGGARRATAPALVGWMASLGLLEPAEVAALSEYATPVVSNHRGLVTGSLVADEFPGWTREPARLALGAG
jgi:L-asparaginase II